MEFKLATGTFDVAANVDGWVITSATAVAAANPEVPLQRGDRIDFNGDAFRPGQDGAEFIGNIA